MPKNWPTCLVYLVRGFIKRDFVNWLLAACDQGDLSCICELLQWQVSIDELRGWNVFAKSYKHAHILKFWIDSFIKRGLRITNEDPLFDVLKHNYLHLASEIPTWQNPTSAYFATLFGIVTRGGNDDKLQFAIKRYERFGQYCFENPRNRRRIVNLFAKQFSNFILKEGLVTGLFDIVGTHEIMTWVSHKIPTDTFAQIYRARYQTKFKLKIFCGALTCTHMGAIAFLAELPEFHITEACFEFVYACQDANFVEWLLQQNPKLYLPLLQQTYFLCSDSALVIVERPTIHLNRILCWLLDSLTMSQLYVVLPPLLQTLENYKCYKRKEFLKHRYLLSTTQSNSWCSVF